MILPIDLDIELKLGTIEIDNVRSDTILPSKFTALNLSLSKLSPKQSFLHRHIPSKYLTTLREGFGIKYPRHDYVVLNSTWFERGDPSPTPFVSPPDPPDSNRVGMDRLVPKDREVRRGLRLTRLRKAPPVCGTPSGEQIALQTSANSEW